MCRGIVMGPGIAYNVCAEGGTCGLTCDRWHDGKWVAETCYAVMC